MVRHTLKILQEIMQDFLSVPGQLGMLCFKRLNNVLPPFQNKVKHTLYSSN